MTTTKSPRRVAMVALAAGREAFRDHAHKFSPKKFTQPQLFACLVLKEFERKDYRGVCQLLADCSDLAAAIGLAAVPHFTPLQKASRRLLTLGHMRTLLEATLAGIHGREEKNGTGLLCLEAGKRGWNHRCTRMNTDQTRANPRVICVYPCASVVPTSSLLRSLETAHGRPVRPGRRRPVPARPSSAGWP